MTDSGKINIHGKEYTTVAARVQQFREKHGDKYGIITEIVHRDDTTVVMKATIGQYFSGTHVEGAFHALATGHAEESRASSQINRTSALENCETSAIGRALAAFGMAGTEFASADELATAITQQSAQKASVPKATPELATPTQKARITALMRAKQVKDDEIAGALLMNHKISIAAQMTRAEADRVIKELG